MDTLLKNYEYSEQFRISELFLSVSILAILLIGNIIFQPPIYANDLIASKSISVPVLRSVTKQAENYNSRNYEKEAFENRVAEKYPGLKINDIANGIKHVKVTKYFNGKPVRLNIVEINNAVANDFEVKPVIASNTLNHKNTVRTMAQKSNSIVAINGGYFKPQTGVPLGTLMIDKKIYTGPIYDRVAFGIFEDSYKVDRVALNASISSKSVTIKIDNINQPRMLSSYVLAYTRDWGSYAPSSPQYGVQLQIVGNKIIKASANSLAIPENGIVLVGPKSKLEKLFGTEEVNLKIKTIPAWENVKHIISGGPYLVKNGDVYIDTSAQKLQAIGGRNPRTAIGYTKDNDLILITADGREGSSIGLTLYELANYMKSLGCINAINLDGGGSTVMYVNGQIVNHPAQPGGIALSNALVISKK